MVMKLVGIDTGSSVIGFVQRASIRKLSRLVSRNARCSSKKLYEFSGIKSLIYIKGKALLFPLRIGTCCCECRARRDIIREANVPRDELGPGLIRAAASSEMSAVTCRH